MILSTHVLIRRSDQLKVSKVYVDAVPPCFHAALVVDVYIDIKQRSFHDKTITELNSNQRDRSDFKGKHSISRKFVDRVDGQDVDVCQQFYLATLNISKSHINTYTRTKDEHRNPGERQLNEPWDKTQAALKKKATERRASKPRIAYVLPQTRIKVIQPLSICKLYRLYKEWCVNEDVTPVSEYVYSEILNTETQHFVPQAKK